MKTEKVNFHIIVMAVPTNRELCRVTNKLEATYMLMRELGLKVSYGQVYYHSTKGTTWILGFTDDTKKILCLHEISFVEKESTFKVLVKIVRELLVESKVN